MRQFKRRVFFTILLVFLCALFLAACGKKEKEASDSKPPKPEPTQEVVEEKDYLSVQTSIAYSSGDTKNWSYGNLRKEFPDNKPCFVRIGSKAITSSALGKGKSHEIAVTYRFTGTENCPVSITDGRAKKVESKDPNVTEYTYTITADKEKKATEELLIFRYTPDGTESVVLEVLYDDQIAEKYDVYNTVYFYKVDEAG